MSIVAAPGLGPLQISDLTSNGVPLHADFHNAITDVNVNRSINMASTLIMQLTDPKRVILNSSNFFQQGNTIEIPDGFGNYLQFVFNGLSKASDQIQVTFYSRSIYDLRNTRAVLNNTSDITDAASFVQAICRQLNIPFVGPAGDPTTNPKAYAMGSGTTYNPDEDAWTTFQRMAGTLGWRCWESAGTVFFGPDEYWLNGSWNGGHPPVNSYFNHTIPTLKEFTNEIQLMDFGWDVGVQYGDVSITCMAHFWQYNPGEIINLQGLGPASGNWLVSSMQRNFFNPQAIIVATIPMPAAAIITPPTLPIVGGRLPI